MGDTGDGGDPTLVRRAESWIVQSRVAQVVVEACVGGELDGGGLGFVRHGGRSGRERRRGVTGWRGLARGSARAGDDGAGDDEGFRRVRCSHLSRLEGCGSGRTRSHCDRVGTRAIPLDGPHGSRARQAGARGARPSDQERSTAFGERRSRIGRGLRHRDDGRGGRREGGVHRRTQDRGARSVAQIRTGRGLAGNEGARYRSSSRRRLPEEPQDRRGPRAAHLGRPRRGPAARHGPHAPMLREGSLSRCIRSRTRPWQEKPTAEARPG